MYEDQPPCVGHRVQCTVQQNEHLLEERVSEFWGLQGGQVLVAEGCHGVTQALAELVIRPVVAQLSW